MPDDICRLTENNIGQLDASQDLSHYDGDLRGGPKQLTGWSKSSCVTSMMVNMSLLKGCPHVTVWEGDPKDFLTGWSKSKSMTGWSKSDSVCDTEK